MIANAYAKINLTLEVLSKRSDGYHDIVSVMHRLALHDTLSFVEADEIALESDRPELIGEDDLVVRAARLLRSLVRTERGAKITLQKRIPVAAGLGGGSSDAAATLLALRTFWHLEVEDRRLMEIAGALGSDVPYFLGSPTALAEGRGEILRDLPQLTRRSVVLVAPRVSIPEKTRRLYGALRPEHYSDGAPTRSLVAAIEDGRPIDRALLVNTFERVAEQVFPSTQMSRQAMLAAGAGSVHLSGSGPTLYSLCKNDDEAERIGDALRARLDASAAEVIVTKTY